MRRIVIAIVLLGLFLVPDVFAQKELSPDTTKAGNVAEKVLKYKELESLPIELTPEEMTRLDQIGITHKNTAPPPGPARNPAEWEPMTGAIIRWPLGIPLSLIREMSEDIQVWTIVADTSQQSQATATYRSAGVNMANVFFILAPTNSMWTRDYGPWFVFDGQGNQGIVDHIYNRPRPLDDSIPGIIGNLWGIPVYGMDLKHTGGNHMSDGLGVSMSSRLVYDENPAKTPAQVDSIMKVYLGNDYKVLGYVETSGIHHIDCWAKFLDPTTILVKQVSPGQPSYDSLNHRAEFLSTQISAWGRPYTIKRIYCPSGTAYTNSIILNNKVFVPTFNNTYYDTTALRVYRDAMPGYEVLGFNGSWYEDDAIHCRIMGVTDRYMLFLNHIPLFDTEICSEDYLISVEIKDHSEMGLLPESLLVYYKTETSPYHTVNLQSTPNPDSFFAYLPAQPPGSLVSYYIKAADSSGRVVTHPPIGALGAHTFSILGDNVAPQIISPDSFVLTPYDTLYYYPEIYDPDDSVHQITYFDIPWWCTVQNDSLMCQAPESSFVDSFGVIAKDLCSADTQMVNLKVHVVGDANGDGMINSADVSYLINYLFISGPAPQPWQAGNANCDGSINSADVAYLINYLFISGPPPTCD